MKSRITFSAILTIIILFIGLSDSDYAQETRIKKTKAVNIIADHTVVDKFDDIPLQYMNLVKQMLLNVPGESHSQAYRTGLELLEDLNAQYAVNITAGEPEAYTDQHLRVSNAGRYLYGSWWEGIGESGWYASSTSVDETKTFLQYCNTNGYNLSAFGFGWCWDMSWLNGPSGEPDPVYGCRWAGSSDGGPQGNLIWGLDAEDFALTGNTVCMDTYLNATQEYADLCETESYDTKVFFTTGPVDGYDGENGYQRQVKHDYIRNFVLAEPSRILFDYADILSWNDEGIQNTETWSGHEYQMIHPDNLGDGSIGHIGEEGALRLGKALWWMLARIAGWDGSELPVELTSFTASVSERELTLNWQTATEKNNYGFEIERMLTAGSYSDPDLSEEESQWEKIGFVAGAGNSNSPKSYSFVDNTTAAGQSRRYRLKQIDLDGKYSYSEEITVELSAIPTEFSLSQNYPNPFNPETTIEYSIPVTLSPVTVSLVVYNFLGQEVATLVNAQQSGGNYNVKFDASSASGGLASGMYIYRIEAGSFSDSKRMILVK